MRSNAIHTNSMIQMNSPACIIHFFKGKLLFFLLRLAEMQLRVLPISQCIGVMRGGLSDDLF